jgi:hypothetical protein
MHTKATFRSITILIALAFLPACYEDPPMNPGEGILRLTVESDSAPADGATLLRVLALIPKEAASDRRTVVFSTSAGTFADGGQGTVAIIALDSVAETFLRAPRTSGPARVRAQLGTEIREVSVQFDTAYPARIDVEPKTFVLKAGVSNETTITASLRRNVGQVSPGVEIRFEAVRADNGEPIGQFGTVPASGVEGTITARYTAGETTYRGLVVIRASTRDGRVVGEGTLTLVNP